MPTALLFLEFLGTSELLVIAVVALLLFGPRKLPEIGRSVGKALGEFKRASDDFKRTWEYEVELERRKPAVEDSTPAVQGVASGEATALPAHDAADSGGPHSSTPEPTVARGAAEEDEHRGESGLADGHAWDVATGRAAARPAEKGEDELNAS